MSIVHEIGIAKKNNKEIEKKKSIEVIASKGIIGDRFFHDFNSDREQITLIESENIDYYNKTYNTDFDYLDFRRNIITITSEILGIVIYQAICKRFAPSILADSYNAGSMELIAAR